MMSFVGRHEGKSDLGDQRRDGRNSMNMGRTH
jgi:hypothetical protein